MEEIRSLSRMSVRDVPHIRSISPHQSESRSSRWICFTEGLVRRRACQFVTTIKGISTARCQLITNPVKERTGGGHTERRFSTPFTQSLKDDQDILHRLTLSLTRPSSSSATSDRGSCLEVEHPAFSDDVHVGVHPSARTDCGNRRDETGHGEGEVDFVKSEMAGKGGCPALRRSESDEISKERAEEQTLRACSCWEELDPLERIFA